MIVGLSGVMPCCDPSVGWWDAIWSNTCELCTTSDFNVQQAAQQQQGLQPGQIPSCDPNAGFFTNLLSSNCNMDVTAQVNSALGLPSIPSWVWALGLVGVGLVVLKVR